MAPFVEHTNPEIARAALAALRIAAMTPSTDRLPSIWHSIDDPTAVRTCLHSQVFVHRLLASAIFSAAPTRAAWRDLERALDDPLYTVRWNAIIALQQLAVIDTERLRAVLLASGPRARFDDVAHTFEAACLCVGVEPPQVRDTREW